MCTLATSKPAVQRYPSEYSRHVDEQTGAVIHQLTQAECVNHPPYFLTSAFPPDGKSVIFTSYRSGSAQLHEVDFPDGEIRRLTDVENFHPYSAILSPDGSEVFYTRGPVIEAINRNGLSTRTLYELPGAQFGECAQSPDGKWLVTALKKDGKSGVAVAAVDGSGGEVILEFERTIIHPQFHSLDSDWIEFAGDPAPRMFRIKRDGSNLECLYEHDNNEFVVHETFLGKTGDLAFTVWPFALKRMDWNTKKISTIANFNAWHITPNQAGTKILCDTNHPDIGLQLVDVASGEKKTICHPKSSNGGSQWKTSRYAVAEDWAAARDQKDESLSWMEMKVDTVYGPQWTHPHPAFSHDESMATYTSDASGYPQVYVVELK